MAFLVFFRSLTAFRHASENVNGIRWWLQLNSQVPDLGQSSFSVEDMVADTLSDWIVSGFAGIGGPCGFLHCVHSEAPNGRTTETMALRTVLLSTWATELTRLTLCWIQWPLRDALPVWLFSWPGAFSRNFNPAPGCYSPQRHYQHTPWRIWKHSIPRRF